MLVHCHTSIDPLSAGLPRTVRASICTQKALRVLPKPWWSKPLVPRSRCVAFTQALPQFSLPLCCLLFLSSLAAWLGFPALILPYHAIDQVVPDGPHDRPCCWKGSDRGAGSRNPCPRGRGGDTKAKTEPKITLAAAARCFQGQSRYEETIIMLRSIHGCCGFTAETP